MSRIRNTVNANQALSRLFILQASRAAELGFRPQKEISYNKLLPYAEDIDSKFGHLLLIRYSSI
jgi:hypothetical protein